MADNTITIDSPEKGNINSKVALYVAITASFMALCNVKDGNIVQSMSQAQAHSIDAWSYYQAKSTRQAIAENTVQLLQDQNTSLAQTQIIKYKEEIARYEKEKAAIKLEAEGYQKQYDDINLFDDQFDMTEALLTISIAMLGITSLTQKRWLLYFSTVIAIAGIIFGLTAFMKISLHSDFISRILG